VVCRAIDHYRLWSRGPRRQQSRERRTTAGGWRFAKGARRTLRFRIPWAYAHGYYLPPLRGSGPAADAGFARVPARRLTGTSMGVAGRRSDAHRGSVAWTAPSEGINARAIFFMELPTWDHPVPQPPHCPSNRPEILQRTPAARHLHGAGRTRIAFLIRRAVLAMVRSRYFLVSPCCRMAPAILSRISAGMPDLGFSHFQEVRYVRSQNVSHP